MRKRNRILLGVVALGIPITGLAVVGGPSLVGAAQPAYPVICKMSATVSFSPPLTLEGTDTTNKAAVTTTTVTNGTLTSCLSADAAGAPTSGTIPTFTINTPAIKGEKVGKVQHYTTGSCPAFASPNTLKSLKHLQVTVNWTGGQGGSSTFTVTSPGAAFNSANELGFVFSGKAVLGSYSEKPLNQITAYLDQADSGALGQGCSSEQVVTGATIDPATSVAIL